MPQKMKKTGTTAWPSTEGKYDVLGWVANTKNAKPKQQGAKAPQQLMNVLVTDGA